MNTWKKITTKPDETYHSIFCCEPEDGIRLLRERFPNGPDELNLVMFSTSGLVGSYATIEDVERDGGQLTFVIIRPRTVTLHSGSCIPKTPEDFEFLKRLRRISWDLFFEIGRPEEWNRTGIE